MRQNALGPLCALLMEAPQSTERAVCKEHGLRYDPQTSAGCVLCRKHSLPAAGMSAAPVAAPGSSKTTLFIVLGIVGLLAVFGLAKLVKMADAQLHEQAKPASQTSYVSDDKLVTLSVPSTWRRKEKDLGVSTLILLSPGDAAAISVIDDPSSIVEAGYTIGQYLENVGDSYRKPGTALTMDNIDRAEYFEVDGEHGLRASWTGVGSRKNRVAGYMYIVQSATHFHQFLALTDQSLFASRKAEFDSLVSHAKLNAGGLPR